MKYRPKYSREVFKVHRHARRVNPERPLKVFLIDVNQKVLPNTYTRHELVPVYGMDLPPEMSKRQRNEGKNVKALTATQDPLEGKRIELQWQDGLFYDATIGKRQKNRLHRVTFDSDGQTFEYNLDGTTRTKVRRLVEGEDYNFI